MYNLVSILILIVCILLVLIVLVQNSKGGGLVSNFTNTGQVMGVRKTADFLEKSTWTLAVSLVVLCLFAAAFIPRAQQGSASSRIMEQVQRSASGVMSTELPAVPVEGETTEEATPIEIETLPVEETEE